MYKIIIAGGRTFNQYELLCRVCDKIIGESRNVEIVSGNANGADKLGEKYAKSKKHSLKIFKADWDRFGKSAGYRRNEEMAKYADVLIAFWDGKSKGTGHMIDLAKKHGLGVTIINY